MRPVLNTRAKGRMLYLRAAVSKKAPSGQGGVMQQDAGVVQNRRDSLLDCVISRINFARGSSPFRPSLSHSGTGRKVCQYLECEL